MINLNSHISSVKKRFKIPAGRNLFRVNTITVRTLKQRYQAGLEKTFIGKGRQREFHETAREGRKNELPE